jgi:hypothetical protein
MSENLLKTWEILAPDECSTTEINELTYNFGNEFIYSPSVTDSHCIWRLHGYIQQCIYARNGVIAAKSDNSQSDVSVYLPPLHDSINHRDQRLEHALLTAYLTALAVQRPITPGLWRHFKGELIEVEENWARQSKNFLGLVNAKDPEHEGLLRFVEVTK